MPEQSAVRIILQGYRKTITDATAGTATTADVDGRKVPLKGKDLAAAQIKIAELEAARVTDIVNGVTRRVRTSSGDPVDNRMRTIALRLVQKKDAGRSAAWSCFRKASVLVPSSDNPRNWRDAPTK